jgi:hypothetical protein
MYQEKKGLNENEDILSHHDQLQMKALKMMHLIAN